MARAMSGCTKDGRDFEDFSIVLRIERDGSVSRVYADRHRPITDCMVPQLVDEKLLPPPFTPYYELIDMRHPK